MATVTLELPDDALTDQDGSAESLLRELRLAAAIYWYGRAEISQEKAAELAGMDRRTFLRTLADRKIDVFVVDMEDLDRELARG